MIRLHLLGSVELTNSDGTVARSVLAQPKRVALLAYLAVAHPHGYHRRDKLLGLFWPEKDTDHARNALRQALHFLRRSLGDEVVRSRGNGEVGIVLSAAWVDVVAFEEQLEADPSEALALYRGELMDGFFLRGAPAFEHWLESERTRLRGSAWDAARRSASELEHRGDMDGSITATRRAATLRPLHEETERELIRRLLLSGDPPGALEEYEAFVKALAEEFDAAPEAETRALMEDLARPRPGEPEPAATTASVSAERAQPGKTVQPPLPWLRRLGRQGRWPGAAAVSALVVLGLVDRNRPDPPSPVGTDVAVLAPEYLGNDPDGPFLARGLQDEIIRNLNGESWIRAPSMLSVSRFAGRSVPLPEIGRELGVSYVVESTVDGLSPDLRFTFRVVEVATDRAVLDTAMAWERRDLVGAPEAVSRSVGEALSSELGIAASVAAPRARPAVDPDAWDRYLVGKARMRVGLSEARGGELWRVAHDDLVLATELAPDFTEAYAHLAILDGIMFWMGEDQSAHRIEIARASLARASEIDRDAPIVRLARGFHTYFLDRDWEGALAAARAAELALGPESEVLLLRWISLRRLGHFEEAAADLEELVAATPAGGAFWVLELAGVYMRLRRFADAERTILRLEEITGEARCNSKYRLYWFWRLDLEAMEAIHETCPDQLGPNSGLAARFWHTFRARDFEGAIALTDSSGVATMSEQSAPFSLDLWRGWAAWADGDLDASRRYWARAVGFQQSAVDDLPVFSRRHELLAWALAGAGRRDEALREADRAVELADAQGDRWAAMGQAPASRVSTLLLLGENEAALDQLEDIFAEPYPYLYVNQLRLDPTYDPIRLEPRFQAIVSRKYGSQKGSR